MADTFASFNSKVGRLQKELTDDAQLHALGKMAKDEAMKAASADLGGDPKFSGWSPKLDTRYDIVGPNAISFHPTRRSAGPWSVAEYGRNSAAGPRMTGPRLTQTGRVSKRRMKRWNGRTAGKNTATEALAEIDKQVPKIVEKRVGRAISKLF